VGSSSDVLNDPHALAFQALPGPAGHYRLALPIRVFDTVRPTDPNHFGWTYSGLHVLEIAPDANGISQLHLQGVIRTEEPDATTTSPSFAVPDRGVLNGDSVFSVHGDQIRASLWQDLPQP
jgi:hypothetical protein